MNANYKKKTHLQRPLAALLAGILGMASSMVHADVTLDPTPLTVQKKVAPNLLFILDDSGSMGRNYMPDWNLLKNNDDNDALINANNNGVYYDPTVTYTPPPTAIGGSYPSYTDITKVPVNGFASTLSYKNLSNYSEGGINHSSIWTEVYTNVKKSTTCDAHTADPYYFSHSYSSRYDRCTVTYKIGEGFFQYSTGPISGPYEVHYVAPTDCGGLANCVTASDTSGTAAPVGVAAGANVANWFAYYHTRLLAAKSGIMHAFSEMDPEHRFGYAAINYDTPDAGDQKTQVTPFGDGSSGTRKAEFWSWLDNKGANGWTPLRTALMDAGKYYQNSQPWKDDAGKELTCRQSFTILTTDGYWNTNNEDYTPNVGNADGNDGATYTNLSGKTGGYKAAEPFSDGNSNTLADIAMHYWKTDLRPALDNDVPSSVSDPAFWQHMTTFTVSLGESPTGISPAGTTVDQIINWGWYGGAPLTNFSWPTPSSDSSNNIADLAHAGINGRGGFYPASNPEQFSSAIKSSLARVNERLGSGASLAANSTKLDTGTFSYQATYITEQWIGGLAAYKVDPDTKLIATIPTWQAESKIPVHGSRNIYTYNPSGANKSTQYVEFELGNLSTTQQDTLDDDANLVNYLRGDSSNEVKNGGTFRNRVTVLGDIVNSQPIFVGAPNPNLFAAKTFSGAAAYSDFATDNLGRAEMIYVAANDGFLHGFDADTGAEDFAYLPGYSINAELKSLASPSYAHKYLNDGELTVADVYMGSSWHTVLVGTTGRGNAKVVYALDITDPGSIDLLWERAATDGKTNSGYIGSVIGKPVIAQTGNGSWSVLLGNGYNSAQDKAALLQFDIDDGDLAVYTTDTTTSNGLAAPGTWDNDNDGIMDYAYAGDRMGRLWKFTLGNTSSATRMFTATDGTNAQPITAGVLLGKKPGSNLLWAFFGTGHYLNSGDLTDKSVQSWYGVIVDGDSTLVGNLASSGRGSLVERTITAEVAASGDTKAARAVGLGADGDLVGKSGWYMDLISPVNGEEGERMVLPNQFQGSLLLGTTRIPVATDVCNPSGRGWIMAVDPFTGKPPVNIFFDLNGDGVFDDSDKIAGAIPAGIGFSKLPNAPIFVGNTMLLSFDDGTVGSIQTAGTSGAMRRTSWREIVNQ